MLNDVGIENCNHIIKVQHAHRDRNDGMQQ